MSFIIYIFSSVNLVEKRGSKCNYSKVPHTVKPM